MRKEKQTKEKGTPYVTFTVYDDGVDVQLDKVIGAQLTPNLTQIIACCVGYICGISNSDIASTIDELCATLKNKKESVELFKNYIANCAGNNDLANAINNYLEKRHGGYGA